MAREGAPHQVMHEAFTKRLRQLFPEPDVVYSQGRKIAIGLKPDVYIRHPDGRQWAFEMVHGNCKAAHLRDNHRRYQEAGIQDIWILWEDLRPKIGTQLPVDQGIMFNLLPNQFRVADDRLTKPQKAILNMQPPGVRELYAFSVSPLTAMLDIQFLDLMSIGLHVYSFLDSDRPGVYIASKQFIPIMEMEFSADGSPQDSESGFDQDENLPAFLEALGYDTSQAVIPVEVFQRLIGSMDKPEVMNQMVKLYLGQQLEKMSPDEIAELAELKDSGAIKQIRPYVGGMDRKIDQQIFKDPSAMADLVIDVQLAISHIEEGPLPPALKKFFLGILNQPQLESSAEWMQWQAESNALRGVLSNERKST